MKKYSSSKSVVLLLLVLGIIVFSLKGFVYSKTDTSGIPLESNPRGIAINPITDIAVVANEKADSVSIVDLNTQSVLSTIPVGKAPRGVAIDRELNLAVVGSSHDNTISVIDLLFPPYQGGTEGGVTTIPVGKEPEGIAIDSSNHTALVTNHKDYTVSVIDLMTYKVIGTISVGREPKDVAIDPELNIGLVANEKGTPPFNSPLNKGGDEGGVSVIDLNTYQVTGSVPVGKKPQAIAINPETHLAGVVNEKDNSITVINLLNWQTDTISVCKHPIDIAINQLDNRALVVCDEERRLLLIDLTPLLFPPYQGGIEGGVKSYSLNKLPKGVAVNNFTNIASVVDDKTDSLTLIQLPNPVPQIISINPDILLRGSKATTINIEGSGFIKTSSISLLTPTPYPLTPVFIDNHNLEITIPEELLKKVGTYRITVTNPAPEGGTSNPVNLQINNPIPSISMLDPSQTMAGTLGLTLTAYGTGFFDDTMVYINGIPRPFTLISQTKLQVELTASDLEVGAYIQVTASNPPPGGGLSNQAVFTVLNPVPSLSSISPTTIVAGSPDFTLTLTGSNFVKTSIVSFNNQNYSARYISKTKIEATIPSDAIKTPGSYPVKVINPPPGGGESSALTFTVKPPLEIKITSPADGETMNKAKIIVKGTVKSDTKDVGINVDGIIADIIGNEWIANNIPLTIGTNTITATATDSYGNTDTKTITIYTNDIIQQVELSANITSGISPLTVFFSASTSFTPVSYQMDFEGDGIVDYTGTTFEDITHAYISEGIFYPTLIVTDDQGNTYSDTIAITVLNKTEIDTLLKGKWEGMKGALSNGDIEKAVTYFMSQYRDSFREAFTLMKDKILINLLLQDELNLIDIYDDIANYENVVYEPNGVYSYPVLFMKDEDGTWKIRSF
jgi:YVTN family beta-propeller protein